MTTSVRRKAVAPRAVRAVAAVAVLLPLLPACNGPEPPREPGATALVVGGRANMPSPQLTPATRVQLEEAFLSRDELVVVDVSGDPGAERRTLSHECGSEPACDGALADFFRDLGGQVAGVRAEVPEADTLGAILLAANELKVADEDGPWQVIVIDSGLQTVGAMPLYTPGALSVEWEAVVEPWDDSFLSDLADVEVLWIGLGATHEPQPELPPGERTRLERLWTGVLEAGDAEVKFSSEGLDQDLAPADGVPEVTAVVFEEQADDPDGLCFRIRDDEVGFLGDEAVFREPELAREVLAPIAEELLDKQLSVTVVGTTALPEDPPYPLSHQRAEAVVEVLAELGVPRSSLVAGGVGTNFAGYKKPVDDRGNFVETLAAQYRLVLIEPVGRQCG